MPRWVLGALVLSVTALVLAAATVKGPAQEPPPGAPPMPPPREIPGLTVKDVYARGCVDCHINYPEMNMDTRLSVVMKDWAKGAPPALVARVQPSAPKGLKLTGKHPPVAFAYQDEPRACLTCHNKASKTAPPFAQMLHLIHLTGGKDNHFLTLFRGECTHCHKLNQKTGTWGLVSGPEKAP